MTTGTFDQIASDILWAVPNLRRELRENGLECGNQRRDGWTEIQRVPPKPGEVGPAIREIHGLAIRFDNDALHVNSGGTVTSYFYRTQNWVDRAAGVIIDAAQPKPLNQDQVRKTTPRKWNLLPRYTFSG